MADMGRTPLAIGLNEAAKEILTLYKSSSKKEYDDSELKGKGKSSCSPPCWVAVSSKGARPAGGRDMLWAAPPGALASPSDTKGCLAA